MFKYATVSFGLGVLADQRNSQNEQQWRSYRLQDSDDVVWSPVDDQFLEDQYSDEYTEREQMSVTNEEEEYNRQKNSSDFVRVFDEIDTDRDGTITPKEMLNWSTALMRRLCGKIIAGETHDLLNELVIGSPAKEQPKVVIDSQSAQILMKFESFQSKEVLKQMSTMEREQFNEKMASLKLHMSDIEISNWIEQQAHLISVFQEAKEEEENQWTKKKSQYEMLSEELNQNYRVLELIDSNQDGVVEPVEWQNSLVKAGLAEDSSKPDIEAFFISKSPDACFYNELEDEEDKNTLLTAHHISKKQREQYGILRSMNEFHQFLDADADERITPQDVGPAFEDIDYNFDNVISREELSYKLDEILQALCYESAVIDRAGWKKHVTPDQTTKKDFFAYFDRNNDGELTIEEYRLIYSVMDAQIAQDGLISRKEAAKWLQDNEDGVCFPFRKQIVETLDQLDKLEKQARGVRKNQKQFTELRNHKTLTAIYNFLDADRNKKVERADVPVAFQKLDRNKDGELTREELNKFTERILYQLCFESASRNHDEWSKAIATADDRYQDIWDILDFDKSETLDITEFNQLYEVVDLDDDYVASRVELTAWFKGNEGTICRPFKTSIEKALDDSQLKSLSLFFSFLDANGDGKIEKADVKVAFSTLDQNGNRWLSRRELSSVSDPIISQMCREFANINKEKFLKLSKKQKSTKKDLFALLDKNNNGKLTSREYRQIYRVLDVGSDTSISEREAQNWVNGNLDTICRKYRPSIIKALLRRDRETALQLTSLQSLYAFLDANGNGQISPKDVQPFFKKLDKSKNDKISRNEFETAQGKIYYEICAEDAFQNPADWLKRTEPDESTKNDIFALLDTNDSGVLVPAEMKAMFREMELRKDGKIVRSEIVNWHRQNEQSICRPYRAKIEASLIKLNKITGPKINHAEKESELRRKFEEQLARERRTREKAEHDLQEIEDNRADKLAHEAAERARLAKDALKRASHETNEKERKRLAIEAQEKSRRAAEAKEQQRLARDTKRRERSAREAAEKEVVAREQAERNRLRREHKERDRLVLEQAEQAKLAREAAERARIARDIALRQRHAHGKGERDQLSVEAAKQRKLAKEAAERERIGKEIHQRARRARQVQERNRIEKERAERDQLATERAKKALKAREAREKVRLAIAAASQRQIAAKKAKEARNARARATRIAKERYAAQLRKEGNKDEDKALNNFKDNLNNQEESDLLKERVILEREANRLKIVAANKIREARVARDQAKIYQREQSLAPNSLELQRQASESLSRAKFKIQEARDARDQARQAELQLQQNSDQTSSVEQLTRKAEEQLLIAKQKEKQARIAAEAARNAREAKKNPKLGDLNPPKTKAAFEDYAREAFDVIDSDQDGAISFNQFKQLYSELNPVSLFKNASENTWRRLYRIYDRDGDAKVTWPEAWKVLQYREQFADEEPKEELTITLDMSPEAFKKVCEQLYASGDHNRDGLINFSEFKHLYTKVHPQSALVRANESQWSQLFGLYDRNADSQVSWPEAWKYFSYRENFLNKSLKSIQSQLKQATEPQVTSGMLANEFEQVSRQLFTRNDANKDGVINLAEFTPLYLKVHPGTRFGWASLNQWREMFRLYDRNADQKITWDEAWRLFKFREFSPKEDLKQPTPITKRPNLQSVDPNQMAPNEFKCYSTFQQHDEDKDSSINFAEFSTLNLHLNPSQPEQSYFQKVNLFNQYDQDRNGLIVWREAWRILRNVRCDGQQSQPDEPKITADMSEAVFASTTEELFKLHDGDSDGLINFLEFKRLYVKVHPLTPTRKANDNQWRALFNVYDMDKDGRLNWNESWRYFKFRERFNN